MEEFSFEEKTLLLEILNSHLEGMTEAKEAMMTDPVSFRNIETFTETMQQHDLDVKVTESIRKKVLHDYPADGQ